MALRLNKKKWSKTELEAKQEADNANKLVKIIKRKLNEHAEHMKSLNKLKKTHKDLFELVDELTTTMSQSEAEIKDLVRGIGSNVSGKFLTAKVQKRNKKTYDARKVIDYDRTLLKTNPEIFSIDKKKFEGLVDTGRVDHQIVVEALITTPMTPAVSIKPKDMTK